MDDDNDKDRQEESRPTREVEPPDLSAQMKKREKEAKEKSEAKPIPKPPEATAHITLDGSLLIPEIRRDYGAGVDTGLDFVPVPVGVEPPADGVAWRILLVPDDTSLETIAIEIWTDAVIGRGQGADVNLADHLGNVKGVSRRHALLRPSPSALFLLDLGSSNGTQVNAVPLNQGMAHKIRHDDLVVFGRLQFTINVVQGLAVG